MFHAFTRAARRMLAGPIDPHPRDALAEFTAAVRDPLVRPRLVELQRHAGSGPLAVHLAAALNLYACTAPGRRQFHANEVLADASDEPSHGSFDVADVTPLPPASDCWFRLDTTHGLQPVPGPGGPAVPLAEAAERSGWTPAALRELWAVVTRLSDGSDRSDGGGWKPNLTPADAMRFRAYEGQAVPVLPGQFQDESLDVGEAVAATGRPALELIDLWRTAAGEGGGGGRADGLRPAPDVTLAPVGVGTRIIDLRPNENQSWAVVLEVKAECVIARIDPPTVGPQTFAARYDEFAVLPQPVVAGGEGEGVGHA